MNIELLQEYIEIFTREVVDSGFKRDLDDYISSLPSAQSNIVALREITGKVITVLDHLYSSDLPEGLRVLLPKKQIKPFTETPHDVSLISLSENTEIQQQEFSAQLTQLLNLLNQQIQENITELDGIRTFIAPYLADDIKNIKDSNLATIAIVFKEHNTITSLKQFTKTLSAWNRTLPIYHQLITSESPEDIKILEVQNGSIDIVVNMNMDVALDLVELFKVGFHVFAAYLSYKKMIKPIIDSYYGNKLLINQEEEREKLLLENIGAAIHQQIELQHERAIKSDKQVDKTAIAKKIEQVTNLISSHIVNGNDLKLLALPESNEPTSGVNKESDEKDALRKKSQIARSELRNITPEARQKLLGLYGKLSEDMD
jgi:hypothetical protein